MLSPLFSPRYYFRCECILALMFDFCDFCSVNPELNPFIISHSPPTRAIGALDPNKQFRSDALNSTSAGWLFFGPSTWKHFGSLYTII